MFLYECRFLYFLHFNTDYLEVKDKRDANLPLNEWESSVLADGERFFNDVKYQKKYFEALNRCIIARITHTEKSELCYNLDSNILDKYKQIRKRVKEQKAISKDEQALYTKFSQFYSEVHNMMLESGFK